jgi:hypothetical protein
MASCPDHRPVHDFELGWYCACCGAEAPVGAAAPVPLDVDPLLAGDFLADRRADLDAGELGAGMTDADYYDRISGPPGPLDVDPAMAAEFGQLAAEEEAEQLLGGGQDDED